MKGTTTETWNPTVSPTTIGSTTVMDPTSNSIYFGIRRTGGGIPCPVGVGTVVGIPGTIIGAPTDTGIRVFPGIHRGTPAVTVMGVGTTIHSIAIGEAITGAAVPIRRLK
jgi:hypothetical protein